MAAAPTQPRRSAPLRLAGRAVRSLTQKPWAGANPIVRGELAAYALVALASLAVLAVAVARSVDTSWPLVAAMVVTMVAAGSVTIAFGPSEAKTDCSDVFLAISVIGLGTLHGGAVVGLASCVVLTLTRSSSWQGAICIAGFMGSFAAAAVLIETGVAALDLHAVSHGILAVAAMFLTWRLIEIASYVLDAVFATETSDSRLWSKVWQDHGESIKESMTWLVTFAPTAALGAFAFELHPATILLVAAPYTVAWNNTRHAARLAHAEHKMGTDELTGLANRAKLFERAHDEMRHAEQYGHELVLVLGDLDNFKRVNDTMGHLIGDEVLAKTADAIRRSIDARAVTAARYGGEEFVLLLPATDLDAAYTIVEAMRETIKAELDQYGSSISFGIARREPGDNFAALMHRADEAMYTSKLAGKNRTTTWTQAIVEITDHAWGIDGRDAFGNLPGAA